MDGGLGLAAGVSEPEDQREIAIVYRNAGDIDDASDALLRMVSLRAAVRQRRAPSILRIVRTLRRRLERGDASRCAIWWKMRFRGKTVDAAKISEGAKDVHVPSANGGEFKNSRLLQLYRNHRH